MIRIGLVWGNSLPRVREVALFLHADEVHFAVVSNNIYFDTRTVLNMLSRCDQKSLPTRKGGSSLIGWTEIQRRAFGFHASSVLNELRMPRQTRTRRRGMFCEVGLKSR